MKVEFTKAVEFSTNDGAFTGEGIPQIPEGATRLVAGDRTTAFVAATGEAWERYNGRGTATTSRTYYWPALVMCPRAWAKEKAAKEAATFSLS